MTLSHSRKTMNTRPVCRTVRLFTSPLMLQYEILLFGDRESNVCEQLAQR